jgi:protein disulfide-isomerase A6
MLDTAVSAQVRELIDQAVLDVECLGMHDPGLEKAQPAQLCFIAFLPDILDSKAEGRNGYIDALKALAADYKER